VSRGPFSPALAISVPSVTALNTLTLADVPIGTVATTLDTGATYVIGAAGAWSSVSSAGTSWFDLEAAFHASLGYGLTRSLSVPSAISNDIAILGTAAVDAVKEGGALKSVGGNWAFMSKATTVVNLATSAFAVSFQASMAAIAVSNSSYVGLKNNTTGAVTGHQLAVGTDQSQSGTNFVGIGYNGTSLTTGTPLNLGTADANVYTWRLYGNGTTATLARAAAAGGGANLAAGTFATNATNYPSAAATLAFVASTASTGSAVYGAVFSFVGPV